MIKTHSPLNRLPAIVVTLSLAMASGAVFASSLGPEFILDTKNTGGSGFSFDVAGGAGGTFAVLWSALNTYPSPLIVQAFRADGTASSPPLTVGSLPMPNPTVAMSQSGNFMTAWIEASPSNSPYGNVYVQQYTANGSLQGKRQWLGSVYNGAVGLPYPCGVLSTCQRKKLSSRPQVMMDDDGDYAVAWTESSWLDVETSDHAVSCNSTDKTYAAVYHANGKVLSYKHLISRSGFLQQAAMNGAGSMALTYAPGACNLTPTARSDLYPLDLSSQVSVTLSSLLNGSPATTGLDSSGNLLVGWAAPDASGAGNAYVARFAPDGSPLGTTLGPYASRTPMAVAPSGAFALGWNQANAIGTTTLGLQTYASDGNPASGALVIDDGNSSLYRDSLAYAWMGNNQLIGIWVAPAADGTSALMGRSITP